MQPRNLIAVVFIFFGFLSSNSQAVEESSSEDNPAAAEGQATPLEIPKKSIEDNQLKDVTSSPTASSIKQRPKFGVSLYYSTGDTIRFSEAIVTSSGSSVSASAEYRSNSQVGLGLSVFESNPYSWGYSAGVIYEPSREISSVKVVSGGSTSSAVYTGSKPKASFLALEGNAVYRANNIYFPIGLNYSIPTFVPGAGATGSFTIAGSLGYNAGIGFLISDAVSLEIILRSVAFKLATETSTSAIDYGRGIINGACFGFRASY